MRVSECGIANRTGRGSESAVASFFQPTSQKPKERTTWSERAPDDDTPATLLVGRYEPEGMSDTDRAKRRKIAAFDLVSLACLSFVPVAHAYTGTPRCTGFYPDHYFVRQKTRR